MSAGLRGRDGVLERPSCKYKQAVWSIPLIHVTGIKNLFRQVLLLQLKRAATPNGVVPKETSIGVSYTLGSER